MEGLKQLGIDPWSILIYIVNTGLLIVVLIYLLYKPILKVLEERQKKIRATLEDSEIIKNEFEAKLKEIETEKIRSRKELEKELTKMEAFVETKQKELSDKMEAERIAMVERTNEDLKRKKEKMVDEIEQDLGKLIKKIVLDIVKNKIPEKVIMESISEGWDDYKKINYK